MAQVRQPCHIYIIVGVTRSISNIPKRRFRVRSMTESPARLAEFGSHRLFFVDGALCFLSIHSSFRLAAVLFVIGGVFFCVAEVRGESAPIEALDAESAANQLSFTIPAQPLEDALIAYAKATGVEVFVDHALVVGRRSGPIQGVYSFEAALQQMLTGTSLDIRRAAPRAYTLVAMSLHEPPPDRAPSWSADRTRSPFFTALQASVKQTLCAQPEIVPGQYRAALAIWTDPVGRVVEARLLGASVDVQAARRLLDGIKGVSVGQPPPAGLEQPVTFVILPRRPDQTGDCAPQKANRR
jgi:hypothetical protein